MDIKNLQIQSGYICGAVKGNSDAMYTALPVRMRWRFKLQSVKTASLYRPSIYPPVPRASTITYLRFAEIWRVLEIIGR